MLLNYVSAMTNKGTTVGGFVLVTHANVSHTTVNTSMIVRLAYHKLYNRPASPLSCLCSSSCSSALLNENKSGVVNLLQWEIKEYQLTFTLSFIYQKGLNSRALLSLACTAGQTPVNKCERRWPAGLVALPQTRSPSPSHSKLYTNRRPPDHIPVCFRSLTRCIVQL